MSTITEEDIKKLIKYVEDTERGWITDLELIDIIREVFNENNGLVGYRGGINRQSLRVLKRALAEKGLLYWDELSTTQNGIRIHPLDV